MDKLKLSQWGERLKTGGAQMGRLVSDKFKAIMQAPTPESKMVDEATLETLEEPNWGMNLRICGMINGEEFSGTEIVRAIKKKISAGKSPVSQRLSLDLLEACTMNCEKVFSEVASEKVLDEMVRMIENPQTDPGNRDRALQLIRAWGESEDLEYLPVFRQTFMILKERSVRALVEDGNSPPVPYSLESYVHQQPLAPPESYPVPDTGLDSSEHSAYQSNYGGVPVEEKSEVLVTTRNTLELLSSILSAETDPKPIKEDLTVSLLEKCKESQSVIQRIVETTTNDEAMLFEALNLHEELQQVISRYEELEAGLKSSEQHLESTDNAVPNLPEYKEVEAGNKPSEQHCGNPDNAVFKELDAGIRSSEDHRGSSDNAVPHPPNYKELEYKELEAGLKSSEDQPRGSSDNAVLNQSTQVEHHGETKIADSLRGQGA